MPGQWSQAMQILTKKQFALFSKLLEAETDDAAVALYTKMEDGGIPLLKLIQLGAVLDKQQSAGLEKLKVMVGRHREGWKEDGDATSDAEGDG